MGSRRWQLRLWGCLLLLLAALGVAGLPATLAQPALQPLRVQLRWLPQAQFAGFYVAQDLKMFEGEGLSVTLQAGGPSVNGLQRLIDGQADVAMGWTSDALNLRRQGADLVNVAQLLQRPGSMLVCRADSGVRQPTDLRGKRIGTWFIGDQFEVGHWLQAHGLNLNAVQLIRQRPSAQDFLDGRVDCATAMSYNEFQTILRAGLLKSELFSVRLARKNSGFLEDGLYVRAADLNDPAKCDRLVRLLRSLAQGWRYAARYPDEAVAITERYMERSDGQHQEDMLQEILQLMDLNKGFGLLDPAKFARSVEIVGQGSGEPAAIARAAEGAWSLKIWRAAQLDGPQRGPLGPAGRQSFSTLVNSPWFYGLDLVGTTAFGLSGFLRALQRRYDIWGCFILTLLPAVGGGTLRDLLIGGMRSPPFIFKNSSYLLVVALVMLAGSLMAVLLSKGAADSESFNTVLGVFDSIGLATFTIIGAQVALEADLSWWWMAICAALTCAGGGMLLDVVTGREPRTFQGEPYEEIAVLGALVLIVGLMIADHFETLQWPVLASMVVSWAFVFASRQLVVRHNLRSWRPGL
ncbi:TRIC cation channel family protein [Cyanobium sp. Aljojuca 7D2]|uniref:ABC transporter substrate-binding protein n=1 Tax=Cyanobium sp. Aljojuca 7D2 TaxID=2823698 RepID=UPI0020CC6BFB|nr:ABC transporter substrate-binding protein [Cyanobium sp. Aljojuca 7D2]MCP9890001.1 TRIC cation channel family protein [Cyanobium sp. Aljojuca 7D2]